MIKTMLGGVGNGFPKTESTPEATAAIPSAAPRIAERRVTVPVERWRVFCFSAGMRRPYQRPHAVAIGLIDGKAKNCTSVGDNRPMHSVCASLLRIRYAHDEVLETWIGRVLAAALEVNRLESGHGRVIGVLKVGGEYSDAEFTFIKAIRPKKVGVGIETRS